MTITPQTIQKTNIGNVDVTTQDDNYDFRISLKQEAPIDSYTLPPTIQPSYVRIKQRKRCVTQDGMWAFDFTCSWNGQSKTDAEKSQLNNDPTFEIEVELLKPDKYLSQKSAKHASVSMLMKVQDLIGNVPFEDVNSH